MHYNKVGGFDIQKNYTRKDSGISIKQNIENLLNKETCINLQQEIEYLWSINNIDITLQKAYLECINRIHIAVAIQFLAKEIESLDKKIANSQKLYASIEKRENTLKFIKEISEVLSEGKVTQEIKENVKNALESLRFVSVVIVEYAGNVREQLKIIYSISGGTLEHKYDAFPIIYKGINYLAKMNNDTMFLSGTSIAKFFRLSNKSDPFLLTAATPYLPGRRKIRRRYLGDQCNNFIELPISIFLLKRIKVADLILLKEKVIMQKSVFKCSRNKSRLPKGKGFKTPIRKHSQPKPSKLPARKPSIKVPLEINKVCNISPLRIRDLDVPKLIGWYRSKLSDNFAKSYCSMDNLLSRSQAGCNSIWLGYSYIESAFDLIEKKDPFALKGLAVVHIDSSSQQVTRILILHASVLNEELENLREFLHKLMDYIWTKINCDEIRVELHHFTQNNKTGPYEALKSEYQRLKFKWKTLVNDECGDRILTLGLNRPEDRLFDRLRGLDCNKAPVIFKHGVLFTLTNESTERSTTEEKETHKQVLESSELHTLCSYLQAIKEIQEYKSELIFDDYKDKPLLNSLIEGIEKLSTIV